MEFPVAVFDLKKYLFKEKLLINYLLLILEYKKLFNIIQSLNISFKKSIIRHVIHIFSFNFF